MAKQNGRGFLVKMDIGGTMTTIAGQNTGTITINNEPIDVTSKTDQGWRTLLPDGTRNVDISVAGFSDDDATFNELRNNLLNQEIVDFEVTIPGTASGSAGSFTFSGILASLEESGEEGGALSFSATIQATGTVTWVDLT